MALFFIESLSLSRMYLSISDVPDEQLSLITFVQFFHITKIRNSKSNDKFSKVIFSEELY